jgi:hypothetical protein
MTNLVINGTTISPTDDIYVNGVALANGKKVFFNGTEVWRKQITASAVWTPYNGCAISAAPGYSYSFTGSNVSSIVLIGARYGSCGSCYGAYRVTFTSPFPDTSYTVNVTTPSGVYFRNISAKTTSYIDLGWGTQTDDSYCISGNVGINCYS